MTAYFDDSVTVSVQILGEADSYALANHPAWMSVSGDAIGYGVPACDEGDFSVSADVIAHRDGLTDQASLTINATRPLIERLNVGGVDYFVVGDEIEAVGVACGEETMGSYHVNVLDGWVFGQTSQVPDGFVLNSDGTFSYTPSCAPGSPEQTQYANEATKEGVTLDSVVSTFDIEGVEQGEGPAILGLDYNEDGQVNNNMLPSGDALELEVPYFCSGTDRFSRIISNDPDNTTYAIVSGSNAVIDDTNRLRFGALPDTPGCDDPPEIDSNGNVINPKGLANTLVIEATNPSGTTTFSVDTRAYSPMISYVYVEPAQTSGGSERDPYVAQFDSNNFSEMINLPYDRIPGQPHRIYLVPVISHGDVALMRPSRNYVFEHNNQPFWMDLDAFGGLIHASPTASEAGFLWPEPTYRVKVGGTYGPGEYLLNITITNN